ncbi:unnamed protein product, partial [Amoebophrya sp. A120]
CERIFPAHLKKRTRHSFSCGLCWLFPFVLPLLICRSVGVLLLSELRSDLGLVIRNFFGDSPV